MRSRDPLRTARRLGAPLVGALMLTACGGGSSPTAGGTAASSSATGAGSAGRLTAAAQLGRQIFSDTALSTSGQQSCASCHVAQYAFSADPASTGPDQGAPVALGGVGMDQPGFRNAPSLMYASFAPSFYFDSDGQPNGGFFRDGRADTLADQAQLPFVIRYEMGNEDAAAVIARLRTRPYLAEYEALYGSAVLSDPDAALERIGEALAAFETQDPQFHPFSSRYDYWQKGEATLSAQELQGLALFNNPGKGNCAACHPSRSPDGSTPALFTDFSYDNLGVPRNPLIPGNVDASSPDGTPVDSDDGVHGYYDLGICGPFRLSAGSRNGPQMPRS